MGPGGLVCRGAPFIARGEQVEIVIDIGDDSLSVPRAAACGCATTATTTRSASQFIGMPVCVRNAHISAHELDVVDKIAAAA